MGILLAVLAVLALISVIVSVATLTGGLALGLSANFTWEFWMYLAIFLMLAIIACILLQRKHSGD
jgi:uncharacterized protein (DUF983 family)